MAVDEIASLVKFCTMGTGIKVLNSQSLRWSSPHLFNDPFEPDYLSHAGFDQETLTKGLIKEAISMLFSPADPTGKSNSLVAAVSRWRDEDRFSSEEEAEKVLSQLLSQIAAQQFEKIINYVGEWRKFSSSLRVTSFSDKPNNIHNWQRYADNHAGIALRFSAGADTTLPAPRQISYGTVPPLVTSLKQQVAVAFGKELFPSEDDFIDKILSKNKENRAEKEWRCLSFENAEPEDDGQLWYNNKGFSPAELKAVYFGLATATSDRNSLVSLIKEKYPNTKVYQAITLAGRYEIDFLQVATR
ncbi:MAG: DUF2971 domain-containing protein [Oceanicoccus sp.]